MTQMESARKGVVTEEMRFVAEREDLDAELIRAKSRAAVWSSRPTRSI